MFPQHNYLRTPPPQVVATIPPIHVYPALSWCAPEDSDFLLEELLSTSSAGSAIRLCFLDGLHLRNPRVKPRRTSGRGERVSRVGNHQPKSAAFATGNATELVDVRGTQKCSTTQMEAVLHCIFAYGRRRREEKTSGKDKNRSTITSAVLKRCHR